MRTEPIDNPDEEFVICGCARISLTNLKKEIKANEITTLEDLIAFSEAGKFCKACVKPGGCEEKAWYLVDIIEGVNKEMIARFHRKTEK